VTLESKNLIVALRNLLKGLETTAAPGDDEKAFAELKRILNQRIKDLENEARVSPVPHPLGTIRGVD
jgi:hypothetical protein